MKNYLTVSGFLLLCVSALAYQAGASNRTNFGPGTQQPAAQQQYRSFSNYNTRTWGKGVQTRGVQTSVAGAEATDFEAVEKPKTSNVRPAAKKQAVAPEEKPAAAAAAPAAQAPAATQPSTAPAQAMAMPAEAAAMMQQVQGLMGAMGGVVTQQQGQAPAGKGGNQTPAGMPDISALMGGMMPQQPKPAPVKK